MTRQEFEELAMRAKKLAIDPTVSNERADAAVRAVEAATENVSDEELDPFLKELICASAIITMGLRYHPVQ
jgi:hypothetical protein